MKKNTTTGLMLKGSLRKSGVTIYERNGQLITRTATSDQKRSNTLEQFKQRQKMRHTIALWKMLKLDCKELMFTQRATDYQNFSSLANRLPVVFVERVRMDNASFLMPGIPVSDGTLPAIQQELGEVDGMPALLTDLMNDEHSYREKLLLYTAIQTLENDFMPRVRFSVREVFSNDMKGWALVRVIDDRCSAQTIITRCTLYQQYTNEEALQTAAKSYGGLTRTPYL